MMSSPPRLRATQVSIDTRLMQNYRVGSPLPTDTSRGALASAVAPDGTLQLFSIGTNGHVFNIVPDASSDTGWSSIDMGTYGDQQAVEVVGGVDPDGVLFAAMIGANDSFPFTVGKIRGTRWNSTWQEAYSEGDALSKLRAGYGIGGAIENNAGTAWIKSTWGSQQFALEFGGLTPDAISDWTIGKASTGTCCMVSLNVPGDGMQTFKVWTDPTFSTPGTYLSALFSRIALTPYPDANGASAVFLLSASDNGIYFITSDLSLDQEAATVKISGDVQLAELVASTDVNGLLEVFALGTDHALYYVRQDPRQPGGWGTMAPIAQEMQFGQLAAGKNTQGESELFAVSADHTLHRFWRDRATTNWTREQIEIASTGELEVIHTYTTELTVLDHTRTPVPNTTVTVSSLDPTPALINGRSYWIDEAAPVTCTSDPMGKVVVVVETEFLDAPALQFATEFMEDDDYVHVQPNASIQDKFSTLTANDLLNPTNPNNEPVTILRAPYNTQETAGAVADALNQCGMLLGATPRGVVFANKRAARSPRHIDLSTVPDQHWEIDYSSGLPVFRKLSRDTAVARIAAMQLRGRHVRGLFGFDVDLGDVLNMATKTVTQITNVIVTTLTENDIVRSIQLAIELVIDGLTWTFEAVVDLVDQAFALARSVLAKVAATIQDLLDWLEYLFKWDDILRTKEALKFTVNQVFALGEASLGCIKRNADDFFDTLKLRAGGSIQQVSNMNGIKGRTFQQIRASAPPPPGQLEPSMSYNVVATAYYNNSGVDGASGGSGASAAMALSPEAAAALDDFIDLLVSKTSQLELSQDFERVVDWFRQMGAQLENDPQAAMQSALSGLIELASLLAILTLDLVKAILDALLNALAAVLSAFKNYLNAAWDDEFLVGLYRFATGDENATLSLLDLLCLILAIPTTIFYKAVEKAAPFPDQNSLTTYETRMGTQVALAVQALGPGDAPPIDVEVLPAANTSWYVIVGLVGNLFYGLSCAHADVQLTTRFGQEGNVVEKNASRVALISEFVLWAVTCPYWATGRFVKPAFQNAEQTAVGAWLFSQLALVLDMIAFSIGPESFTTKRPIWSQKKMSLHGDVGTTVSVVEGAIFIVIYSILAVQEEDETHDVDIPKTVANLLTSVPYVLRLFRYSPIDKTIVGTVGRNALVVTDLVFYITAGILYFFQKPGHHNFPELQSAETNSAA